LIIWLAGTFSICQPIDIPLPDLGDLRAQLGIALSPRCGRTFLPRLITIGGNAQYAAHGSDWMHGLVGSYELERRDGVAPVS
jgi:hypothetical protein